MKKIFSILAIAAVVALFASCKNNAEEATDEVAVATDTTELVVDSTAVAPVADSTVVAE